MEGYQSVVEWQRPGDREWFCDSLLLVRFSPELVKAIKDALPAWGRISLPGLSSLAANEAEGASQYTVSVMSETEVVRAQAAYERVNGTPSKGLAAVLAQMEGHRAKGRASRFVFWESK
jgi:hypothetical protein